MNSEQLLYEIEILSTHHDRKPFACGVMALDKYLREQATQDIKKHIAMTFVLTKNGDAEVIGYYTLSAIGIDAGELPEIMARKLPKYALLPATLLGRLAVSKQYQGQGIGEQLLVDALNRSTRASNEIASMAIIVDAKNESAAKFYESYGFIRFVHHENKLFIPMATAVSLFVH